MYQLMVSIGVTSLEQGLLIGIVTLGVVIAFRFLDFPDLTVDGSFVLGAAVASRAISEGVNPFLATLLAVPVGALAGTATGLLHTRLGIGKLLSGILMMTMLYSINLRVMGRSNIPLIDQPTILKGLEGSPALIITLLALAAAFLLLLLGWLLQTQIGVSLRAVGESETMLVNLGISVNLLKTFGLAVTNMYVALGGALYAQHQGYCDISMGMGTILVALASVVLGEAFLRPLTAWRALFAALVGAIVYQLLVTIALYLGLPPTDLKLITGLLVVGALLLVTVDGRERAEVIARRY